MTHIKKRYAILLIVLYALSGLAITGAIILNINKFAPTQGFLLIFVSGALWYVAMNVLELILSYVFPRIVDIRSKIKIKQNKQFIRRYERIYGKDPRNDPDFLGVDLNDL